ncbi:MAG: hypothetical protein KAI26_02595 [Nanoarchaeota archaeon]|nr:hypothetical protein [Nanoarchaeota archaeon]
MADKKEIIKQFDDIIGYKAEINESLRKVQQDVIAIKTNNEIDLSRLQVSRDFFSALPEKYYNDQDPVWASMISSVSGSLYTGLSFTEKTYEDIDHTRLSTEALVSTTTALASTSGSIVDISHSGCKILREIPKMKEISKKIKTFSAIERKDEIAEKLAKISHSLRRDFDNAWQIFIQRDKLGWYKNACHSMREVLSDLPKKLDPNDEIKKWNWVEYSQAGGITQRSRIKFAIIGFKEITDNSYLDIIEKLRNNARDLYNRLNKFAHFRKEDKELPEDIITLVEAELSLLQEIIEAIIDLRARFIAGEA